MNKSLRHRTLNIVMMAENVKEPTIVSRSGVKVSCMCHPAYETILPVLYCAPYSCRAIFVRRNGETLGNVYDHFTIAVKCIDEESNE